MKFEKEKLYRIKTSVAFGDHTLFYEGAVIEDLEDSVKILDRNKNVVQINKNIIAVAEETR